MADNNNLDVPSDDENPKKRPRKEQGNGQQKENQGKNGDQQMKEAEDDAVASVVLFQRNQVDLYYHVLTHRV